MGSSTVLVGEATDSFFAVRAEPFNQPLRDLDDDSAASATIGAIRKAMEIAGV